ncbi:MAG: helix-hairpin-helix domain-containing protein [Ginsengibacter sp.]
MENYQVAEHFSLLGKLMDIHGENSFKAKFYAIASYNIDKLPEPLKEISADKIKTLPGIGDATGKKILELLQTGKMQLLDDLLEKTPPGVLEMLRVKGLGPKKISLIWKKMNIENIGELLYACHENRLMLYNGFGEKTQKNVLASIEFYQKQEGHYLYAQVAGMAEELKKLLSRIFATPVEICGSFVRQSETIDELEYVVPLEGKMIMAKLKSQPGFQLVTDNENSILFQSDVGIKVLLYPSSPKELHETVFYTTGTKEFNKAFRERFKKYDFGEGDDAALFKSLDIQYIPPALRENGEILEMAASFSIPKLIQPGDIRGIIHCHSNWSDGVGSIEELAMAAVKKGFEYLVLSDHSKAAFYANGLNEERVKAQHGLVDELNVKLFPFKIFKSIESDILNDGSLDYSNPVLSTFDLVIASVHSNLKMNEEKAMMRLMNAIENPYTTILGHMTGRLLLSRNGFPVNHKKIIDSCSANNVAIELNAHPRRLDMRWQWLSYALEKNVLISVDPDAHSAEEFDNVRYGVLAAQKGMVSKANNLSSFTLQNFEKFLKSRKASKGI